MSKIFIVFLFAFSGNLISNDAFLKLDNIPKSDYFLFLIGDWTYQFEQGKGDVQYQYHKEEKTISGLIRGEINRRSFIGSSLTFYQADKNEWHRRWADSLGNVLQGKPELIDYPEAKGKALQSITQLGSTYFKHIWYNIQNARFETDLWISRDGKDWKMIRRMPYIKNIH